MTGLDVLVAVPIIGVGAWLAARHPRAALAYAAGFAVAGLGVALTLSIISDPTRLP